MIKVHATTAKRTLSMAAMPLPDGKGTTINALAVAENE